MGVIEANAAMIIAQVLVFVAVILIFYSLKHLFENQGEIKRRLEQRKGDDGKIISDDSPSLSLDDGTLKKYEKYLKPSNSRELNKLREKLIRAGHRKKSAVRMFYAWRIGLGAGAVIIATLLLPQIMIELPLIVSLVTLLLMVSIAYFAPTLWVERQYQYRKSDIRDSFPDALDLLLVCIEAGHGFDQALSRVTREMSKSAPVLVDELRTVSLELSVGKERAEVLSSFAARTGVEDIASFITVIKQADKYGVSIAEALRVYSREMRDKRYMRAESKANMMPIKLALGAIVFTVPPVILIMVGPSIIQIARQLGEVAL